LRKHYISYLNKPLVVNLSLGARDGPRDGTSPFEQAVQDYINDNHIAIVAACGNDGDEQRHLGGDNSQSFQFDVYAENQCINEYFIIYIWYDESSNYSITLNTPQWPNGELGTFEPGEYVGQDGGYEPGEVGFLTDDGLISISNNTFNTEEPNNWFYNHFPDTPDKLIIILIASYNSSHMITPSDNDNHWEIELDGSGRWDAYAVYEHKPTGAPSNWSLSATFPDAPTLWDNYTITEPGNAESVITVGALTSKTSWQNANGGTTNNPGYSLNLPPEWCSDGPIRGRPLSEQIKPEIYAPGAWICSALSQHTAPQYYPSNEYRPYGETEYRYSQGTSASAPHMAGAVALYLQDHPFATPDEIRNRINSCPIYGVNSKYLYAPAFLGISYPILPEEEYFENFVSWNFPNPFTNFTTIYLSLTLKHIEDTEIKIYNIKGQLVKNLKPTKPMGYYSIPSVVWNGKDKSGAQLASGIYLYQLVNDNEVIDTKKMLLIK